MKKKTKMQPSPAPGSKPPAIRGAPKWVIDKMKKEAQAMGRQSPAKTKPTAGSTAGQSKIVSLHEAPLLRKAEHMRLLPHHAEPLDWLPRKLLDVIRKKATKVATFKGGNRRPPLKDIVGEALAIMVTEQINRLKTEDGSPYVADGHFILSADGRSTCCILILYCERNISAVRLFLRDDIADFEFPLAKFEDGADIDRVIVWIAEQFMEYRSYCLSKRSKKFSGEKKHKTQSAKSRANAASQEQTPAKK